MASSSGDASTPKHEYRYLTIAKKMKVLNMIKEGKSSVAIARHFGVNICTIFHIKKTDRRIQKTAEITMNKSVKRIISTRHKTFILMEAASITWINFCLRNNITLDCKTIKTKARDLYETFSSKEIKNSQNAEDIHSKVPRSKNKNAKQSMV